MAQQVPVSAKRPPNYYVVDYLKSIQGTRLSDDGQWLTYATTAQADDGELFVRNLKTGQEFRQPRGTAPQFTPDAKFVVFTIAQAKAEEEKDTEASAAAGSEPGRGANARREPRTGFGIMSLPDGQVKTFDKVGSFRIPEKSSTWAAYYKGVGGASAGGAGGARGARGGAAQGATGARGGQGAPGARGAGANGAKRKDPGSDLIVRNLVTGDEATIPDVSEYEWDPTGDWLAYAVSSADAAKDGVYARHIPDGAIRTLQTGRGHYKSLAFDAGGTALAFLRDETNYAQKVSTYRV